MDIQNLWKSLETSVKKHREYSIQLTKLKNRLLIAKIIIEPIIPQNITLESLEAYFTKKKEWDTSTYKQLQRELEALQTKMSLEEQAIWGHLVTIQKRLGLANWSKDMVVSCLDYKLGIENSTLYLIVPPLDKTVGTL